MSKMSVLLCTAQLFSTSGKSSGRGFVQFTPAHEKYQIPVISFPGITATIRTTHCNTGKEVYS